ncbi:MAG: NAD(P)H-dependent oxidoreductase [Candidatus Magasanikbacteria bacterium]|jgi:nitroreductase|nr:NAD(P)H-dependent oxidoreductase [Candidatus Magasanikbacteria bacterium]
MNTYIENLMWRYATKQFDPTKKLTDEQLHTVLEAMRLAPTSFGIQPYKLYLVENPDVRMQLRDASWGQSQVTDASRFIVVASRIGIGEEDITRFVENIKKTRGQSQEEVQAYQDMMMGSVMNISEADRDSWCARQSYIALGFGLSAAAQMQVDACPMEGFDVQKINEILNIPADGYSARAYLSLGFRSSEDKYAEAPKVRYSEEEIIKRVV